MFLLSGVGLVYYAWVHYVQNDWEPHTEQVDRRERLVTAYSLAVVLTFVIGALVTPPDPTTQVGVEPTTLSASLSTPDSVGTGLTTTGETTSMAANPLLNA